MQSSAPAPKFEVKEEKIVDLNNHYFKYYYQHENNDYCRTYTQNEASIGACSVRGLGRPKQEDFLTCAVDEVQSFSKLSYDAKEVALRETIKQMQAKFGQEADQGSTACITTAYIGERDGAKPRKLHLTTANLGDSRAYIVALDTKGKVSAEGHLNSLHKPDKPDEYKRIMANPRGVVGNKRLMWDLSLSRAIGDTRYDENGMSHVPEINHHEPFSMSDEFNKVFIVVASDGLEKVNVTEVVKENNTKSPTEISQALVAAALRTEIHDNISVAVMEVGKTPTSAAVFDGHGGEKVAKNLSENFYPALKQNLDLVANPEEFIKLRDKQIADDQAQLVADKLKYERRQRNAISIVNKLLDELAGVSNRKDLHAYINNPVPDKLGKINLTFASSWNGDARSYCEQIEALAKSNGFETFAYSYAGNDDGHPNGHRFDITFNDDDDVFPQNFHKFMQEAKQVLAKLSLHKLLISPKNAGSQAGLFAAKREEKEEAGVQAKAAAPGKRGMPAS